MKKLDHHLIKINGWFHLRFKFQGKEFKCSLGTKNMKKARDERDYLIQYIKQNGRLPFETEIKFVPFGEVAKKWAKLKRPTVSPTTWDRYKANLNKFIIPVFGNKAINQITTLDIDEWLVDLYKNGFAKKTNKNIFTPLSNIFTFAKKHKLISINPCDEIEQIKGKPSSEKHPLSMEEIKAFLDACSDFYRPLFTTMFLSGLRVAEATGLQWKHIDLHKGQIRVRQNLVWLRGKMYLKEPKKESTTRNVMVCSKVVDALREQRKRTWNGEQENFVFLNKNGGCLKASTLATDVFKHTLRRAGLPLNRSLKDTRNSYITNALDAGERLSFVQRQAGHTTPHMIIHHYYGHIPSPDDGSRFESAWEKKCTESVQEDSDVKEEVLQRMFESPDKKRG